jgi:hypothetical protein
VSLAEVLAAARALPRDEQLELVRSLVEEGKGQTEQLPPFFHNWISSGAQLEMNLPFQSPEAAVALREMLVREQAGT